MYWSSHWVYFKIKRSVSVFRKSFALKLTRFIWRVVKVSLKVITFPLKKKKISGHSLCIVHVFSLAVHWVAFPLPPAQTIIHWAHHVFVERVNSLLCFSSLLVPLQKLGLIHLVLTYHWRFFFFFFLTAWGSRFHLSETTALISSTPLWNSLFVAMLSLKVKVLKQLSYYGKAKLFNWLLFLTARCSNIIYQNTTPCRFRDERYKKYLRCEKFSRSTVQL